MDPRSRYQQSKYFASLDGLRAISILAVIWHHASHGTSGILSRGYLGVHLFFAISGVLITTLLLRERDANGQISLRDFYVRRTLRIFPLYYAVIGLYVLLVFATERGTARGAAFFVHLPAYLTYTSNWFVGLSAGSSVIFYFAWSLATEEQFYLFWPSIVRFSRHWSVPAVAIASILAAGELTRLAQTSGYVSAAHLWVKILSSIASPICVGCLAAIMLHRPKGFTWAYAIAGQPWSAPLALGLLVLVMSFESPSLIVALVMTYLVTVCVIRNDHYLRPLFANRFVRYVGSISYGMYLLHMIALNAVRRILGSHASQSALFVCTCALATGLASLSYYAFERRFLQLKKRFSRQT